MSGTRWVLIGIEPSYYDIDAILWAAGNGLEVTVEYSHAPDAWPGNWVRYATAVVRMGDTWPINPGSQERPD